MEVYDSLAAVISQDIINKLTADQLSKFKKEVISEGASFVQQSNLNIIHGSQKAINNAKEYLNQIMLTENNKECDGTTNQNIVEKKRNIELTASSNTESDTTNFPSSDLLKNSTDDDEWDSGILDDNNDQPNSCDNSPQCKSSTEGNLESLGVVSVDDGQSRRKTRGKKIDVLQTLGIKRKRSISDSQTNSTGKKKTSVDVKKSLESYLTGTKKVQSDIITVRGSKKKKDLSNKVKTTVKSGRRGKKNSAMKEEDIDSNDNDYDVDDNDSTNITEEDKVKCVIHVSVIDETEENNIAECSKEDICTDQKPIKRKFEKDVVDYLRKLSAAKKKKGGLKPKNTPEEETEDTSSESFGAELVEHSSNTSIQEQDSEPPAIIQESSDNAAVLEEIATIDHLSDYKEINVEIVNKDQLADGDNADDSEMPESEEQQEEEEESEEYLRERLICGICRHVSVSRNAYKKHKYNYHSKQSRECKICGHKAETVSGIRKHMLNYHSEHKFQCDKADSKAMSLAEVSSDTRLSSIKEICFSTFSAGYMKDKHRQFHFDSDGKLTPSAIAIHKARLAQTGQPESLPPDLVKQIEEADDLNPAIPEVPDTQTGIHIGKNQRKQNIHAKNRYEEGSSRECEQCFKILSNQHFYDIHIKKVHGGEEETNNVCNIFQVKRFLQTGIRQNEYKCPKCEFITSRMANFTKHFKTHTNPSVYYCDVEDCIYQNRKKAEVARHKRNAHDERNFQCTECAMKFRNAPQLGCHMKRTHTMEYSKMCDECGKVLSNSVSYKYHMQSHHTDPAIQPGDKIMCQKCGRVFRTVGSFRSHLAKYHANVDDESQLKEEKIVSEGLIILNNGNLFQCKYCVNYSNTNAREVRQHIVRVHLEKKFACEHCEKAFSRESFLLKHIAVHHSGYENVECPECGMYKFDHSSYENVECGACLKNKYYLAYHRKRMHRKTTAYDCEVCQKSFFRKLEYETHLELHKPEDERNWKFECEVCQKRFRFKSNLEYHMLDHTGVKAYMCPVCKRSFKTKTIRNSHMLSHSHDRPFNCAHCDKTFKIQKYLDVHLLSHNKEDGVEKFSCKACCRLFPHSEALKKHICRAVRLHQDQLGKLDLTIGSNIDIDASSLYTIPDIPDPSNSITTSTAIHIAPTPLTSGHKSNLTSAGLSSGIAQCFEGGGARLAPHVLQVDNLDKTSNVVNVTTIEQYSEQGYLRIPSTVSDFAEGYNEDTTVKMETLPQQNIVQFTPKLNIGKPIAENIKSSGELLKFTASGINKDGILLSEELLQQLISAGHGGMKILYGDTLISPITLLNLSINKNSTSMDVSNNDILQVKPQSPENDTGNSNLSEIIKCEQMHSDSSSMLAQTRNNVIIDSASVDVSTDHLSTLDPILTIGTRESDNVVIDNSTNNEEQEVDNKDYINVDFTADCVVADTSEGKVDTSDFAGGDTQQVYMCGICSTLCRTKEGIDIHLEIHSQQVKMDNEVLGCLG